MEVRKLISEGGNNGSALGVGVGVLGRLVVDRVYWSGEREKSLTTPPLGIGVEFSGRPLVKAITFLNPITNHTYTLSFNKENAVGNSMLLSDEVKGDGANNARSDDVREGFQVHLCVGKPGRVQKKEDRKRVVFVQVVGTGNAGKGAGSKGTKSSTASPVLFQHGEGTRNVKWERWELDGLMKGLTRLWLEKAKRLGELVGLEPNNLPRHLKRGLGSGGKAPLAGEGDTIGVWLERDVLGFGVNAPVHKVKLKKKNSEASIPDVFTAKSSPTRMPDSTPAQPVPMYLQPPDEGAVPATSIPPPPLPRAYRESLARETDVERRGRHRKAVLWREMWQDEDVDMKIDTKVEEQCMDGMSELVREDRYWWEI
ncbi:hypothetical protein BDZ91DRAFT_724295 [Kalaharituber pfeilii]|nr:hypothetical protein BDZ91DRAFT_724295 [Kalaharituber pfeilii]